MDGSSESNRWALHDADGAEPLLGDLEHGRSVQSSRAIEDPGQPIEENSRQHGHAFALVFVSMLAIGLGSGVMQKVQTEPMKNYPLFLSLLTTFIFIPASFAYIVPMAVLGNLSENRKLVSQYKVSIVDPI